jgi:branched-chain amino acid transport system substrate-binding protein
MKNKMNRTLLPILVLMGFVLVVMGCSAESPQERSVDQLEQTDSTSFFESDGSADTTPFHFQIVYPGDSLDTDSLVIGLDAAMTGDFAKSGVSIWRGMVLAVDEINESGGLLGRKLQIFVKDHRANPARGVDNIESFAKQDRLLAVMGGMHTPVILNELPAIHENRIISLVPWAAGTPIVDNSYDPNYVFRLSVRDQYAGPYLVNKLSEAGYENPALLLENTGWGRSNKEALTKALEERELSPALISFFNWSKNSFRAELNRALKKEADSIIFVGNAPEGVTLVQSMANQPDSERLPILSHWGITGGEFFEKSQSALSEVTLRVLQTRSFLDPANPEYAQFEREQYCSKFDCPTSDAASIVAPAGTAHAHDLVHLLRQAVRDAGTIDRPEIRKSLTKLDSWSGVVGDYDRPFTRTDREALTIDDYRLARFDSSGGLVLGDLP